MNTWKKDKHTIKATKNVKVCVSKIIKMRNFEIMMKHIRYSDNTESTCVKSLYAVENIAYNCVWCSVLLQAMYIPMKLLHVCIFFLSIMDACLACKKFNVSLYMSVTMRNNCM